MEHYIINNKDTQSPSNLCVRCQQSQCIDNYYRDIYNNHKYINTIIQANIGYFSNTHKKQRNDSKNN